MSLPLHPLATLFPAIDGEELDALVESLKTSGLRDPITVFDGMVLDGRNRQRACDIAGVAARYEPLPEKTDPLQFVLDKNLSRRHLNETQRGMVAAKIATMKQGHNSNAQICALSQDAAAGLLNIGRRTVQHATEVLGHGTPELIAAVEHGDVSVSAAAELSKLPKEQQTGILAQGSAEVKSTAKRLRNIKKNKTKHRRPRGSSAPTPVEPEPRHNIDLRRLQVAWETACASAREQFMRELDFAPGQAA